MDLKYIKKLCECIGIVKKFKFNEEFFGNIELEIKTPNKTLLSIISDRGIFSCYITSKKTFWKLVPIEKLINMNKSNITFYSLEDTIDFLKKYIKIWDG